MKFWSNILNDLKNYKIGILMVVVESHGSSPGRQGFKMYLSTSGEMFGSIGGGIMEYKMVEYCKNELIHTPFKPFLKKQIHLKDIAHDKSGMICSGEQTIAFIYMNEENLELLESINNSLNNDCGVLSLSNDGLQFDSKQDIENQFYYDATKEHNWLYKESLNYKPLLQIIGGGHVSLALSKFAFELGFDVIVYDDRDGINTMQLNRFATTYVIEDYNTISQTIKKDETSYIVIMSFGYLSDKIVLTQLIPLSFKYIGMMGSKEKIKKMFDELVEEGYDINEFKKVNTPIGLAINSRTTNEIAVSIMAEIIKIKNQ